MRLSRDLGMAPASWLSATLLHRNYKFMAVRQICGVISAGDLPTTANSRLPDVISEKAEELLNQPFPKPLRYSGIKEHAGTLYGCSLRVSELCDRPGVQELSAEGELLRVFGKGSKGVVLCLGLRIVHLKHTFMRLVLFA